ncbi:hybrid sensor histidine kinase/response regulator [Salinibius halmophilus]|uniref:hybrid sensor histidine kinase/response regulator n=1 Tax=Salinibius halmophilus TaxID=1853216 RepID=UPI000E662B29|nr:7TM diverse intracellular signaling domain-containing protein [Salinibius halmophilus]
MYKYFSWLLLLAASVAFASPIQLSDPDQVLMLERQLSYSATDQSVRNVDQLSQLNSVVWTNGSARNRVGFQDGKAYWYRASLSAATDAEWMALVEHAQLKRMDAFLVSDGKVMDTWSWAMAEQNEFNSFKGRPRFTFHLQPGEQYQLYLRIEGNYSVYAPLILGGTRAVSDWLINKLTFLYVFFGVMLGLLLYNGVLALVVRQRSAKHYCFYLLFVILYNLQINGFGREWIGLFDSDYMDRFFVFGATLGVVVFSLTFSRSFLELDKEGGMVQYSQLGIALLLMIAAVGMVLGIPSLFVNMMQIAAPVFFVFALVMGARAIKKGNRYAIFYELGWTAMAIGTTIHQLLLMGYLPTSFWFQESMRIGASVEALMLSWALAMRLRAIELRNREVEAQAKVKLQKANEQLSHALHIEEINSKMKEDFIRLVGHELRTPLNALVSSIDLMCEQRYQNVDEFREDSHIALARLNSQVENLVTASELARESAYQENAQGVREWADIDSLLDKVLDYANDRLKDKQGVELIIERPEQSLQVFFDQQKVERCIVNVVDNAIKFCDQGKVVVSMNVTPGQITFTVTDQGPGMSAEQRERAFDIARDKNGEMMLRKHEGFGLGLYVTTGLIRLLSGEIRYSACHPHGLRVDLALPAQTREDAKDSPRILPATSVLRVLVVEDNRLNAKLMATLLEAMQMDVTVAENGERAVNIASEQSFDLILMDLQMPVLDGFSATRIIRQSGGRNNQTTILAASANSSFADRDAAMRVGMNGFISKPIRPATLKRELARFVELAEDNEVGIQKA